MAVRVKVVAQYMTVQAGVYIEEPSRFRIIIPTLQIVQFGLSIVVVPAVAEGVICPHDALLHRGRIGCRAEGEIPPGVIRIRTDFLSGGVIDSNNVPLQVLLKEIVLELPGRHALRPVLQPDGSAVLVVQVYKTVYAELLRHDLAPIQQVAVLLTANRLGGPDPVCIVGKPVVRLQHGL